jgi:hypothetical protein
MLVEREPPLSHRPMRQPVVESHAGKSAAAVVSLDGVRADVCRAANWAGSQATCEGKLLHHSSRTIKDRRARTDQGTPHQPASSCTVAGTWQGNRI